MSGSNLNTGFDIRAMRSDDWPAVRNIYSEGIATGNATFETEIPEWERWDQGHLQDCRLVAQDSQQILGWAALSPVSSGGGLFRRGRGFGLRGCRNTRSRSRKNVAAIAGRTVGAMRDVDPASRNFPGECCQHWVAQVLRIPRSRTAQEIGSARGRLEGRSSA